MDEKRRLIVGLGNPGTKYEMTRHNLGWLALKRLAQKWEITLKSESKFSGLIGAGVVEKNQVLLLLPTTYMNLSGTSIRKVCDFYKIPFDDRSSFLVVVDDVYIKFGTMRLRDGGSSGGHNGLKSIEEHLHTKNYARLRMGIGPNSELELMNGPPLEDYVLATFNEGEKSSLPTFIDAASSLLEKWITGWDAAVEVLKNKP